MLHKAWNSKGEMPYCFPRSSVKFQGHTVQNITDFDPNWAFPDYRPVAAFKSLRFALFVNNSWTGSMNDSFQLQLRVCIWHRFNAAHYDTAYSKAVTEAGHKSSLKLTKRHPIARPLRRAMGCLLWRCLRTLMALKRFCGVINKPNRTNFQHIHIKISANQ